MDSKRSESDGDWVETVVKVAGALGLNRVRVRWKLEALRKRWNATRFRAGEQAQHIAYQHKLCPACGRLNDGTAETCLRCGRPLGARTWHVLHRVGLIIPQAMSVSSLLGTAMVIAFGRMLLGAGPGEGLLSFDVATLLRFGGNWSPAVFGGYELWRLGTSIFLHAGLWHLGFNLLALSQIGPPIEEIFGRGRMLLFFMVTGLLAALGSAAVGGGLSWVMTGTFLIGAHGVSIGASGAIMGLTGLAAGWGQRDGTRIGRDMRNQMLKWCAYTILFGLFIGADNAAHVVGFVTGGIIGLVVPPRAMRRSERLPVVVIEVALGSLLALSSIALCIVPPASPANDSLARQIRISESPDALRAEQDRLCALPEWTRVDDLGWGDAALALAAGFDREKPRALCRQLQGGAAPGADEAPPGS
jgi:rhomboid protease GluP